MVRSVFSSWNRDRRPLTRPAAARQEDLAEHVDHLVIGGGQAGASAALAMRDAGFGGSIAIICEEKYLPYERPPLSKAFLSEQRQSIAPSVFQAEYYSEHGIDLVLGARVDFIDTKSRQIIATDGRRWNYSKLLVATGGSARRLNVPGNEAICYLRTMDDALKIQACLRRASSLVCIGAGVIGLEMASSARALGCDVTVVEAAPVPMARCLDRDGSRFIEDIHRRAGVQFLFGSGVDRIIPERSGRSVVVCDNGVGLPVDMVVAGVGMVRNVDLAVAGGMAIDEGIIVDEHGRTSVEDVYAAGDVAAFWHPSMGRRIRLESWRHAQSHGTTVGRNMCGIRQSYDEVPSFWTEQYDLNIQVAGQVGNGENLIRRQTGSSSSFVSFCVSPQKKVLGLVAVDSPKDARAGLELIRTQVEVDPRALQDASIPLRRLALRRA